MLTKGSFVALALALALACAGATTAEAIDLCFSYVGGGRIVAKGFKMPRNNKCTPFNGFEVGGGYGAFSGVACKNADYNSLILHYTLHDQRDVSSYFESGTCRTSELNRKPGDYAAANCSGTYVSTPGGTGRFTAAARLEYCNVEVPL